MLFTSSANRGRQLPNDFQGMVGRKGADAARSVLSLVDSSSARRVVGGVSPLKWLCCEGRTVLDGELEYDIHLTLFPFHHPIPMDGEIVA